MTSRNISIPRSDDMRIALIALAVIGGLLVIGAVVAVHLLTKI